MVKAFVSDILTPLVAAIFGKSNFETLTFTIHKSHFLYGDLINSVISFLSVAAAIYFVVVVPLNKIAERRARGQAPADEVPPPSDEAVLLTEIRDLVAVPAAQRLKSPVRGVAGRSRSRTAPACGRPGSRG